MSFTHVVVEPTPMLGFEDQPRKRIRRWRRIITGITAISFALLAIAAANVSLLISLLFAFIAYALYRATVIHD